MKGDTRTMILFIASVLFSIFILTAFMLPSFIRMGQGLCWANVNTMMQDFYSIFDRMKAGDAPVKHQVVLGDCVDELIFTRRSDLAKAAPGVSCEPNVYSMIVVVPNFAWFGEKLIQGAKGVKSICREIPCSADKCTLSHEPVVLKGPGGKEHEKKYCIGIKKISSSEYYIVGREGTCSEVSDDIDKLLPV